MANSLNAANPAVDMESIVRPFVPAISTPTRQRQSFAGGAFGFGRELGTELSTEQRSSTIAWQATASVQITTLPGLGFTQALDPDTPSDQSEISRTTHTVRVTNPDDPTQFVDVEVADAIVFKDADGNTLQQNFNNGDS